MSAFLGPLEDGHVAPAQQTRVGAFLVSLHGALTRQLATGLPVHLDFGWQTELHSQLHREIEIATLMMRATSWIADFELPALWMAWEMAWLSKPVEGVSDLRQALLIDLAALAHAAHGAIRPASLLPVEADAQDGFVQALRRIEFESSRLIQAQILFLKGPELVPLRGAVNLAVDRRHQEVRDLWEAMLMSIGVSSVRLDTDQTSRFTIPSRFLSVSTVNDGVDHEGNFRG